MPHALLLEAGTLYRVVPKLTPELQPELERAQVKRIVDWNPPTVDHELQTVTPVLPVPPEAQVVQFVVADRPLAEVLPIVQARKWAEIKARREAEKVAPLLTTAVGVVDADARGIENLKGTLHGLRAAADLGLQIPPIGWTLADNSSVQLTLPQLEAIAVALLQRGDTAHQTARTLRAQIDAATTVAEVLAVVWPG